MFRRNCPGISSQVGPRITGVCLLWLFFSGCVRAGLPEYVASVSPQQAETLNIQPGLARRSLVNFPTAVLVSSCAERLAEQPQLKPLGNQFILIFIPLTSIFFEHGVQCLLEEFALADLLKRGLSVYLVRKPDLRAVAAGLRPDLTLEFSAGDVSLSVYDLLLVRRISLNGSAALTRYDSMSNAIAQDSQQLEQSFFGAQGKSAVLTALIERELTDAVGVLIDRSARNDAYGRPKFNSPGEPDSETTVVVVEVPRLGNPLPTSLGKFVAKSYGTNAFPDYDDGAILRILQRGLRSGVGGAPAAVRVAPHESKWRLPGKSFWGLQTTIQALNPILEDAELVGLTLTAEMQLVQKGANSSLRLLRARCETRIGMSESRHAHWVLALEQAAAKLTETFLKGQESPEQAAAGEMQMSARCSTL